MLWYTRRNVERLIDSNRVRRAIQEAEQRTSGEIRVSIAPLFWGNVDQAARQAFERLGMTKTRLRNGVLFFIVPSRRSFVVLGDVSIHERVGQSFWHDVVAIMTPFFHRAEFTEGLVAGIGAAGEELARHFPYDERTDVDELPDQVDVRDEPRPSGT